MPSRLKFRSRPFPLGATTLRAGLSRLEGSLGQLVGIDGAPLRGPSGRIRSQLTVAGGGGASYPNLPPGWSILSDRDFLSKTDAGWTDRGDAAFEIVTASGAGGTVVDAMASQFSRLTEYTGRARYNAGFNSGGGPISTSYSIGVASRRVGLYLRFNAALSATWVSESSGVNKIYFLPAGSAASAPVYLSAQSETANLTSGNIAFQVRLQGAPQSVLGNGSGGVRNLAANVPGASAAIIRGVRFTAEVILIMNTCQADGTPNGDGIALVYFNNTLTHQYSNVCYRGNGSVSSLVPASALWTEARWNPTWGGNHPGETLPALQYMYMFDAAVGVGT